MSLPYQQGPCWYDGLPRVHLNPRAPLQNQSDFAAKPIWERNRQVAWLSFCIGVGTGMVMGLWSFDGPFPAPLGLERYGDLSRRLARLGHIAFFGLGFLNLFLARELEQTALGDKSRRIASIAMNFGNVFLPLTLFAAALFHPLKYLMSVPASAVLLALLLAAWGVNQDRPPGEGRGHGQPG